MLQITFLIIGLCIIVLALSFVFKRHARLILWSSAVTIFTGTLLLVGIGAINPVDGDATGSITFWGTIMTLISCAALAFCAEKLKEKNKGKTNKAQNGSIIDGSVAEEHPAELEATVVLSGALNTETARKVFAKAIEAGYMKEEGSHYKWNESKVLLAYMCGRIYCGDISVYDKTDEKYYWKFGKYDFFPDSELKVLFGVSDIGQSRQNRKDLATPKKSQEIDKLFE